MARKKKMAIWVSSLCPSHFNTDSVPVITLRTLYMLITSFRQNIRQNDHSFSVKEAEAQKLEAAINLSPNQEHT